MDLHDNPPGAGGAAMPSGTDGGFTYTARKPMRTPRKARFGGRAARYKIHRQTLLRVYDPVKHSYEVFPNDSTFHAWLVRRFDSSITDLVVRPQPVAYMRLGKRFGAQPDFSFKRAGASSTSLEWVCLEWEAERRLRYEHFQVTHGVDVVLTASRDRELLDETLIVNLEHALQLMTLTQDEDLSAITRAILDFLPPKRTTTRGQLGASLTCERKATCEDCFDAALFHLHCAGVLQLALGSNDYDDDTTITRL